MMNTQISLTLELVMAFGLAGCAQKEATQQMNGNDSDSAKTPVVQQTVAIATYKLSEQPEGVPAPTYRMASVSGTLDTEQGCLVLRRSDDSVALLVFLEGTAQIRNGDVFVDGKSFHVGQNVAMGGSGTPGPTIVAEPSTSCLLKGRWFVAPGTLTVTE